MKKTYTFKIILEIKAEGVDRVDAFHRIEDKLEELENDKSSSVMFNTGTMRVLQS